MNPLGLFDLDRKIRNVGKAYKQLIADWRNVLPAQSVCLVVPIKKIGEIPDTDDAAGRHLSANGTQAGTATNASNANEPDDGSATGAGESESSGAQA